MTDLIPPPEIERDPAVAGIIKKRQEPLKLRRDLAKQIAAIDQSVALLTRTLSVFDPRSKLHTRSANLPPERNPKTRRVVLDAQRPMTLGEIAEAWMTKSEIEDTAYNRRIYKGRVSSALQNCRTKGVAVNEILPDGQSLWRLVDEA